MASKKFLIHLDLYKNELQNAAIQNLASAPGTPVLGQIYFDTTKDQLGVYTSAGWNYGGDITDVQGSGSIQVSVDGNGVATVSIDAASGAGPGSMSSAHYDLVNGATATNTNDTLVLRDGTGGFAAQDITANDISLTTGTISTVASTGNEIVNWTTMNDAIMAVAQGLKPKESVHVASVANINLTTPGTTTFDNHTLGTLERILVKDQTDPTENGIYIFHGANLPMTRALDFDSLTPIDEINGAYTFVEHGDINAGKSFVEDSVVTAIGTDPITFIYFNSIGNLTGGDMITITGADITVDVNTTNGGLESSNPGNPGGQLQINIDTVANSPFGMQTMQVTNSNELSVTDKVALVTFQDISLVAATPLTVTHGLGTRHVIVQVYDTTTYEALEVAVVRNGLNTVTIESNTAEVVTVVITGNIGFDMQ